METLPTLSTTAKTAIAIWLAQSPEPVSGPVASLAVCDRLVRSMLRQNGARRPINRERIAA